MKDTNFLVFFNFYVSFKIFQNNFFFNLQSSFLLEVWMGRVVGFEGKRQMRRCALMM